MQSNFSTTPSGQVFAGSLSLSLSRLRFKVQYQGNGMSRIKECVWEKGSVIDISRGEKSERGREKERESVFARRTWKVWNVQRYDKLKLVKSFLLTLGRRSYLRLDERYNRAPEVSRSIRAELLADARFGAAIFSNPDILR